MINQKILKELLEYNSDTGLFTWKDHGKKIKKGMIAGTYVNGYVNIRIQGKVYSAHRLAFLYMTGAFPVDQVDHINREKDDNRWLNLRESTNFLNHKNMSNNNEFVGVHWQKNHQTWRARILINGSRKHLGCFKTHFAACYARHYAECQL